MDKHQVREVATAQADRQTRINRQLAAFSDQRVAAVFGEGAGHPFRGNQHTSGESGGEAKTSAEHMAKRDEHIRAIHDALKKGDTKGVQQHKEAAEKHLDAERKASTDEKRQQLKDTAEDHIENSRYSEEGEQELQDEHDRIDGLSSKEVHDEHARAFGTTQSTRLEAQATHAENVHDQDRLGHLHAMDHHREMAAKFPQDSEENQLHDHAADKHYEAAHMPSSTRSAAARIASDRAHGMTDRSAYHDNKGGVQTTDHGEQTAVDGGTAHAEPRLSWQTSQTPGVEHHIAEAHGETYHAHPTTKGDYQAYHTGSGKDLGRHPTIEAAKQAAQSHHERNVTKR